TLPGAPSVITTGPRASIVATWPCCNRYWERSVPRTDLAAGPAADPRWAESQELPLAAVTWIRYLAAVVCLWVFSVVPVCDVESEVGVEPVVVGVAGGGGRFTLAGGAKLKARKTIDAIATIAASTI